jgi:hypothetical protein
MNMKFFFVKLQAKSTQKWVSKSRAFKALFQTLDEGKKLYSNFCGSQLAVFYFKSSSLWENESKKFSPLCNPIFLESKKSVWVKRKHFHKIPSCIVTSIIEILQDYKICQNLNPINGDYLFSSAYLS